MSYYSADEIKEILEEYPQYQEKLYCRGFLITDQHYDMDTYPFYGNWAVQELTSGYLIYAHKLCNVYIHRQGNELFFLIGHAYDPFTMQYQEMDILKDLAEAWGDGNFWEKQNELTGVYLLGAIANDRLYFSADCTGMQYVCYGIKEGHPIITSHSKLAADLNGFRQTDYIRRLVSSRFYHYWGTFLPGDITPYREMHRIQPNFAFCFRKQTGKYSMKRYFPLEPIPEVGQTEYDAKIAEIGDLLTNTMELIARKWPEKKAAISVTGGRDSTMTLASSKKVGEQLGHFSYISNDAETVDAEAAHQICSKLGLDHEIYTIPSQKEGEDDLYKDIEVIRKIFECNAGCIGHNNENDVRKRIYFDRNRNFEVEIKSWVDELCRGEAQNKYNTRRFPKKPTPGYYRCMWKVIVDPILIHQSNRIFRDYLKKYYTEDIFKNMPWTDLFYWEFSWGAGEGTFLTSEHRYSYDITIPYNNRMLLAIMFQIPLEERIQHRIPIDVIRYNDKRVEEANIVIKDVAHTDMWSFIIRMYLRIFGIINI